MSKRLISPARDLYSLRVMCGWSIVRRSELTRRLLTLKLELAACGQLLMIVIMKYRLPAPLVLVPMIFRPALVLTIRNWMVCALCGIALGAISLITGRMVILKSKTQSGTVTDQQRLQLLTVPRRQRR